MPRLTIAPEARQDLQEIRDRILKESPKAARRVIMRLRQIARLRAGAPSLGRDRPELGMDLRSFVADRYLLFYRPLKGEEGIDLVRVLHGARDIDAIFTEDKG
jgi:toxin ParE1/3/4